jgi:hypothetical protein
MLCRASDLIDVAVDLVIGVETSLDSPPAIDG